MKAIHTINVSTGNQEIYAVAEPYGWYFGIPYYAVDDKIMSSSHLLKNNNFHFVERKSELRFDLYVYGKINATIYKFLKFIEYVIYWNAILLFYKWGFMPLQPEGEVFQWKYFLSLPKG